MCTWAAASPAAGPGGARNFLLLAVAGIVAFPVAVILHNVVSAALGGEEAVFFVVAVVYLGGEPAGEPRPDPPGLYEPVGGFGKLWYAATGSSGRARLGWARDPEVGGPGARQMFSNGLLLSLRPTRQILVLYLTSPYAGPLHQTQFYLDTFAP